MLGHSGTQAPRCSLRVIAPAKLNLYLRVVRRLPDGFHELETFFERIDLADQLFFESHPSDLRLSCDDPTLSCGSDNLILRAAQQLRASVGVRQGAIIHLEKRIPIASGLGGGSSDAASTLLALNQLWSLGLTLETLLTLGAQLGSDVPFFLHQAPYAIGRDRGQQCEPVEIDRQKTYILAVPDQKLSTRSVFEGLLRFGLTPSDASISMFLHALCNGSQDELAEGLSRNDLAPEAIRRCPTIRSVQKHLQHLGCKITGVSGSGPSVFGSCRDPNHAEEIMTALPRLVEEEASSNGEKAGLRHLQVVRTLVVDQRIGE